MGLSLEYVFGSIVSTAEKARDGAKRCLGEWSLTLSLKLGCELLLSTSQRWTFQGHLEHQPSSCML